VTISHSEFSYIGDNAMAAWGNTKDLRKDQENKKYQENRNLPHGEGIDGTGGEQPRDTKIHYNIVREIGLNERHRT